MNKIRSAVALAASLALASCTGSGCGRKPGFLARANSEPRHLARAIEQETRPGLARFASESELSSFLRRLAGAQAEDAKERESRASGSDKSAVPAAPAEAPSPSADESVTNVQHAGVDEGGIVKLRGEYLVVLRRGRLFTIRVGDDALAPVSAVDAFAPGVDPSGTWYDEMLVSGNTIIVVGYSYQRGGTELGLFDLADDGVIRYRAMYHLRSNDYYSSRNYASRLIGDRLVFYTPLYLMLDERTPRRSFPALRKWHPGATDSEWKLLAPATRVYRPIVPSSSLTLHTVTTCRVGPGDLECSATAVMGPAGSIFYVSPSSVYVWATEWRTLGNRNKRESVVYRLPLGEGEPQALRATSCPVDQFSFLESDAHLNVLLQAEAVGDGMWGAEVARGDVALLRVPVSAFGDGRDSAAPSHYVRLPRPTGDTFHNRFVGNHVLYGTGSGWGPPEPRKGGKLYAVPYTGGSPVSLDLQHGVDRIEALGSDAIVIGTGGKDLYFTPISLATTPTAAEPYVRKNVSQGELRSHGFFYRADADGAGILGLPVRESESPGFLHLIRDSAALLFVQNDALRLRELGSLVSRPASDASDGCRASCVDWYGNARPLFLKGRVFALLGYEIVEGRVGHDGIGERRRISFAPRAVNVAQ